MTPKGTAILKDQSQPLPLRACVACHESLSLLRKIRDYKPLWPMPARESPLTYEMIDDINKLMDILDTIAISPAEIKTVAPATEPPPTVQDAPSDPYL